jgi:enoyl-CoA hydratase/carnithine racemase
VNGSLSPPDAGRVAIVRDGDVLMVTLDHAPGNEVSGAMFEALHALLAAEAAAPSAKVLVLRGAGDAFCTGRERSATTLAALRAEAERLIALKRALRASPLITIARVHGAAAGFGLGLAILSDFAVVADDAQLSFPEMRKGLPPAAIMAYLGEYALPRHAFPLVLFGETFSAAHARDIGLVNDVVPAAELDAAVEAFVARILRIDAASARSCKELFRTMGEGSFDANCRLATDALAVASATLLRPCAP